MRQFEVFDPFEGSLRFQFNSAVLQFIVLGVATKLTYFYVCIYLFILGGVVLCFYVLFVCFGIFAQSLNTSSNMTYMMQVNHVVQHEEQKVKRSNSNEPVVFFVEQGCEK